jgi:hypothetical protein
VFFSPSGDDSGMNHQQRNLALSECSGERYGKTGCNPNVSSEHDDDFTPTLLI